MSFYKIILPGSPLSGDGRELLWYGHPTRG